MNDWRDQCDAMILAAVEYAVECGISADDAWAYVMDLAARSMITME